MLLYLLSEGVGFFFSHALFLMGGSRNSIFLDFFKNHLPIARCMIFFFPKRLQSDWSLINVCWIELIYSLSCSCVLLWANGWILLHWRPGRYFLGAYLYFLLCWAEGWPVSCNLMWHGGKLLTLCFCVFSSYGSLGLCILGWGWDRQTEGKRKEFLGSLVENDLATVKIQTICWIMSAGWKSLCRLPISVCIKDHTIHFFPVQIISM